MTLVCSHIEEEEQMNIITLTAYHIIKNYMAARIYLNIELVIDAKGLLLERLKVAIDILHLRHINDIPLEDELHLGKLRGNFVSVSTYNTSTLLGNN